VNNNVKIFLDFWVLVRITYEDPCTKMLTLSYKNENVINIELKNIYKKNRAHVFLYF